MIRISPFTPLFFAPSNDISGVSSKYVQLFAPSDAIFIQVLTTENEVVSGTLVNKMDDEEVPLLFEAFDMESGTRVYNVLVQGLPIGYYSVKIGDEESEIFKITDDNRELAGTTLISYTMHSNKMRTDGVFWNGEQQFTFYWRAPGGFKDDDWSFAVNNEQFETHQGNIVELFAVESTQKSFTLGNSLGCPIWYAEHLNRLLCCSDVHFNGVRFVRKGNNVPEMTQEIAGKKSYIFKVALQGMIEGIDIDLPEGDSEGESEGGGVGYIYLIKANDYVTPTDENTFSALRILLEIEKMEEEIDKLYLSKVKDDTALGLITLMKGFIANGICKAKTGLEVGEVINTIAGGKGTIIDAVGNILSNSIALRSSLTIGKSGYVGGLTGFGGRIDENANAELESLVLRRFLEVPELRFNRTKVFVGNNWIAPGAGIFERVVPDTDENGNQLMTGTGWLKLEDGECGAIEVGDICMGIFHSLNASDNATADSEQKDGEDIVGFHFSGFYTCYFTITEIVGGDNKQFRYQMRPVSDLWKLKIHPSEAMTFVCYGSFSNDERQSSMYISKSYIRSLVHQNTWEIKADNIGIQLADLRNLSINGHSMANHSAYLNNVYLTGIVKQINAAGHEIQVANDRGNYISGEHYDYYDRVSYDGALWLCIAENGTNTPPSKNDSAWLCQVPAAQSITSHSKWESSKTPYPASTFLKMCDTIFISKVETSEPPYAILKDEKGNYLVNESGGYILHSPLIVSADWEMMLDASGLVDGEDGDSIEVRYSSDKTNWHFPYRDGDKFMQQRIGSESAWSDIITFVGEDGAAGKDGQYTDYQFAVNSSLDVAPATGWQETPPTVGEGQYLWMRMRVVDPSNGVVSNWSVARLGGEEGTSVFKSTVFIRTNDTPGTPSGGSYASPKPTTTGWSDSIPDGEQILWASTRVFTHNGKLPQEDVWTTPRKMTDTADFDVEFSSVESPNPPTGHPNTNTQWSNESGTDTIWMATAQKKNGVWGEWKVSKIKGEKGDMGVSITTHGRWHSGMTVPAMGVVTMAGNSYIAKVETQKPPLFCLLDENGNYLVTENGGYLLNGEENEEYDLLTTSGKDGYDGKDYEWIYQLKATDDTPSRPNTAQKDDFVPSGWNDNPTGVSETLPYEFASFRTKKDGVWSEFSTPAIWAKFGKDGVNAIYADIDNEMDSVALNSDGKSTAATELSTTVSMWNGQTKATLKSISVSAVSGVTSSYTLSSGVVKFNIAKGTSIAEHSEFKITVVATINGVDESRTLTFTLAGVKAGAKGIDAVLYKIITSVNSIVKRKDGTYNAEGVSACRYKVVNGVTTVATNGTLKYLIDDNNESTHEAVIGNNVQIPSYTFVKKVRFTFYDDNGAILDRETVPMIMDGTDGKGFEMYGNWHSGLYVAARGVVQMGGSTFVAKVDTVRPPLCCLLDEKGNYLVTEKGGYLLTGEINTEEYDVWAEKGEPGKDGSPGVDGSPGADGKPGAQGIPGMQGCILRYAEWQPNYEWRNDTNKTEEELKNITGGIRYLDCAFVRNDATSTGWDVYYATETHISTANNAPSTEGSKWKEFSMNVPAIFTNIILAKQAHIDLLQGNDIMAKKADGTVTAGMSGGSDGIRFWAGATQENKATAPFRVNEQGESWLTNAHVSGEVNATSGVFKNVQIDSGTIGGFTIEKGTLRTSTLGSGRIIIEPGINKFIRINDDELSPLFYARNDSGVIMQLNAYGDNATALELLSNSSGSGVALRSTGDAYLVGRYSSVPSVSPHEKIIIAGLSVSCKNGSSFTSPTNVSPSTAWVDFLIANGDITLPSAKNCAGKVLFVKAKGVISCQETNGGIVLADGTTIQVAKNRGNNAMIYISDGNSWYEFYCG